MIRSSRYIPSSIVKGAAVSSRPFISVWDTTNAGSATDTVILPWTPGNNTKVDWGDGTVNNSNSHTYSSSGTYTIKVFGKLLGFRFNNGGDRRKLINITQWGGFNFTATQVFYGCSNLVISAIDKPIIGAGDRRGTFRNCGQIVTIPNLSDWDMSQVTSLRDFFRNCSNFNQSFTWRIPLCNTTWDMLRDNNDFNGVVDFIDPLVLFDVEGMYQNCDSFNNSIPFLERPNFITYLEDFLRDCHNFNHASVANWVTDTWGTYWKLLRGCTAFNQPLTNWNTSAALDMEDMLRDCVLFNQDLSHFDTSNVFYLVGFLWNVSAFNQDISNFNIENCFGGLGNMLNGVTLSTVNYDALLLAWSTQNVPDFLTFHGGGSQYTAESIPPEDPAVTGGDGRLILVTRDSMTITDGGIAP